MDELPKLPPRREMGDEGYPEKRLQQNPKCRGDLLRIAL